MLMSTKLQARVSYEKAYTELGLEAPLNSEEEASSLEVLVIVEHIRAPGLGAALEIDLNTGQVGFYASLSVRMGISWG